MGMIRSMRAEDAEAVAELIRVAFGAIRTPLDPAPSALRESGDSVRRQIEAGGGAVWIDAAVQGCVLWREQEGALYLGRLAVRPGRERRGIARALIRGAEQEAGRRGLVRVTLAVRLALEGNRRLFAAAGFRETALRAHEGYPAPTYVEAEKLL